jgi:type II secretory pathway pseudopilin PulG
VHGGRPSADNHLVRVHRWYLIVLGIAIAVLAYVVIPKIVNSVNAANSRADPAKAAAAFARVRLPSDFYAWLATNKVLCPTGLECFYVPKPSTAISKATLINILAGIGATYDPSRSRCVTGPYPLATSPVIQRCDIYARLDGLYTAIHLDRYGYCDRRRCSRASEAEVWLFPPFTPSY